MFERTLVDHTSKLLFHNHNVETILMIRKKGWRNTLIVIMAAEPFEKKLEKNTIFNRRHKELFTFGWKRRRNWSIRSINWTATENWCCTWGNYGLINGEKLEEVRAWLNSSKEKLTSMKELRRLSWIAQKFHKERKNYNWKLIHNVRFEWLKWKKKSLC